MLFRKCLFLVIMGFIIQACEKDPEPLTTNSMIRGNVFWYSDNGEDGKAKVTVKGPYGSKSVEASNGEDFYIEKLGNGTYCAEFEKDGYGTYERCDIQIFGNDTVRIMQVQLYPKPKDFKIPALTRAYTSYPDIFSPPIVPCISLQTDAKEREIYPEVMIFISSSKDVSWNNYQYVTSGFRSSFNTGNNSWTYYVSLENRASLPFQTGDKVYIRTYACNMMDRGYVDAYLGLMIFPTLDKSRASNAIEFVMP
jgi:hypothetical protein